MKKLVFLLWVICLQAKAIVTLPYYDITSQAYFNKASIFNPIEKQAADWKFIKPAKNNSTIWASLQGGFVYLVSPTSYGASLFNAISTSYEPTTGVAPSFSMNGWGFDGATQWVNTNFLATNMTLNTGYTVIYNRVNSAAGSKEIYGAANGALEQWQIEPRFTGDLARMNAYGTATLFTGANANGSGRYIFNINNNTDRYIRKNEASIATSAVPADGTLPAFNCYIGARNNAGTASAFSQSEVATVVQGLIGLSTANADILTLMVKDYNDTVISGGR